MIGNIDANFSYDTDIDFRNGDLMLVSGLDYLKKKIYKLLITMEGDWKLHPDVGSSPNKFVGYQNTRQTGKLIEEFLYANIQPIVVPAAVSIRVIPINRESVKCYIDLDMLGLDQVSIPFTLDYVNGIKYFDFDETTDSVIPSKNIKFNDNQSLRNPNPYWNRITQQ